MSPKFGDVARVVISPEKLKDAMGGDTPTPARRQKGEIRRVIVRILTEQPGLTYTAVARRLREQPGFASIDSNRVSTMLWQYVQHNTIKSRKQDGKTRYYPANWRFSDERLIEPNEARSRRLPNPADPDFGNISSQLRNYLAEHPGSTVSQIIKGTGIKRNTVSSTLYRYRNQGKVMVTEGKKGNLEYSMAQSVSQPVKKYQCRFCDKQFISAPMLGNHIKYGHTAELRAEQQPQRQLGQAQPVGVQPVGVQPVGVTMDFTAQLDQALFSYMRYLASQEEGRDFGQRARALTDFSNHIHDQKGQKGDHGNTQRT